MGKLAWGLVLLLLVVRFDFWAWDDTRIVLGFLPIGLAYHIGISLAAALAWFLVVRYAWPVELEAWGDEEERP